MVADNMNLYEYPELALFEHPQLTEHEMEYFKLEKNELKKPGIANVIIGGVLIFISLILIFAFFITQSIIAIIFGIFILFMGGAFIYEAITVRGNSEDRFAKGEIRAAEMVIPNAHFVTFRYGKSDNPMISNHATKRCCTGTFGGKRYVIDMDKRTEDGYCLCVVNNITDQMKMEMNALVGRRCLAKLDYRRNELFEITAYIDEILG